jgi:hypothetical protein
VVLEVLEHLPTELQKKLCREIDIHFFSEKKIVLDFLKRHGIYSCGRFGSWEYLSMEDCFIQAKNIATELAQLER